MRKRIGLRLLRPYLIKEMQHWNKLASAHLKRVANDDETPEKMRDAMSRRDQTVRIMHGRDTQGEGDDR
jgi:hypothetical protein